MPQFNPDTLLAIQPELASGENVIWSGQPDARVVFHREDIYLIPFSLLWGGFTLFWEATAAGVWGPAASRAGATSFGAPLFMLLWGIPFVLIGQFLIWGRFLYAAWKKKQIFYAVTNRRIIVVLDGRNRRVTSTYIDTLPALIKEGASGRPGTLKFAAPDPMTSPMMSRRNGFQAWDPFAIGSTPVFRDIVDVDAVYRLVSDLREKAAREKAR